MEEGIQALRHSGVQEEALLVPKPKCPSLNALDLKL
jgi:hypothetical protein